MVSIGAVGGGITEGDYITWAVKWSWSLPNGVKYNDGEYVAFYMEEINGIFYLWWYASSPAKFRVGTYNIANHSAIFESPSDSHYLYTYPFVIGGSYSFKMGCNRLEDMILRSHQTYILLGRMDQETLEVWKAGSLLWSRDITADTGEASATIRSTEISLTGKYILFWDEQTAKLWLYEGS
jgi:hypothetical protein